MPELKLLFLQMAVILVVSRTFAAVSRFAGQPEVVGEMMAGILLGPSVLGRVSAAAMQNLFPPTSLGPLDALSQFGLVLFLFLVGLDLRRPDRLSVKSVVITSYASLRRRFSAAEFSPGSSIHASETARLAYRLYCSWERR
jgi:Kef-type K+ transport system membrane component KefB